jgi:hypothetical protein
MLLVRWSQFILTRYSKLSKWDLMQIRLVKMAGAYSKPFNISLLWYYIKQIMNVFIRPMVRIFSPRKNILTIALINIHYLYNIYQRNLWSILQEKAFLNKNVFKDFLKMSMEENVFHCHIVSVHYSVHYMT